MEFENYNGKKYSILEQEGDYTLLKEENDKAYEPYVVAFLLELDEDNRGEWNQGRYHQSYEDALEMFKEKTAK